MIPPGRSHSRGHRPQKRKGSRSRTRQDYCSDKDDDHVSTADHHDNSSHDDIEDCRTGRKSRPSRNSRGSRKHRSRSHGRGQHQSSSQYKPPELSTHENYHADDDAGDAQHHHDDSGHYYRDGGGAGGSSGRRRSHSNTRRHHSRQRDHHANEDNEDNEYGEAARHHRYNNNPHQQQQQQAAGTPHSDMAVSETVEGPPEKVYFPSRGTQAVLNTDSNLTEEHHATEEMAATAATTLNALTPDSPTAPGVYHLARPAALGPNNSTTSNEKSNITAGNNTNMGLRSAALDIKKPSPIHRLKLNKWYERRFPALTKTASPPPISVGGGSTINSGDDTMQETFLSKTFSSNGGDTMETYDNTVGETVVTVGTVGTVGTIGTEEEDGLHHMFTDRDDRDADYLKTKQSTAYLSICLTSAQLLVLMLQLTMCGVATLDVNPMVGPFPDAFSEFGGKNAYLMVHEDQWWRLVTASGLHVGVLHLLANAFCQLETIALFEREWGSFRWLLAYLLSSVGCTLFSSYFDPNTIAVSSSGSLMGMYAAKLAQVTSHTCFRLSKDHNDDVIRLDQLSGVLCGLTLVSLLSSFTYIDWSGHMGGLAVGFFSGMVLFCKPIANCCTRFFWCLLGLLGLAGTLGALVYLLLFQSELDEEMADACDYFRNLFPEDYDCGCMWR